MMVGDHTYREGGGWGSRTEFSAPEEFNEPTKLFHVGGCEPTLPMVGDRFQAFFYKAGAPDKIGLFRFVEVHYPGDPPDAFFGTVELTHVGTKMRGNLVSWEMV